MTKNEFGELNTAYHDTLISETSDSPLMAALKAASAAKEAGKIKYDEWHGSPDELIYVSDLAKPEVREKLAKLIANKLASGIKFEGLNLKTGLAIVEV